MIARVWPRPLACNLRGWPLIERMAAGLEGLASFAEALSEQIAGLDKTISQARLEKAYRETLY